MRPHPFPRNEDGAVTIDFLVLAATTVTIALSIMTQLGVGVLGAAGKTSDYLANGGNFEVSTGSSSNMSTSSGGTAGGGSPATAGEEDMDPEATDTANDATDALDDLTQVIETPEEDAEDDEADVGKDRSGKEREIRRGRAAVSRGQSENG